MNLNAQSYTDEWGMVRFPTVSLVSILVIYSAVNTTFLKLPSKFHFSNVLYGTQIAKKLEQSITLGKYKYFF